MALVLADRVKETSTTVGTGTITLAGASTGYQSFAAIGNGNTTYYCIAGQTTSEWEVGIGTYTASGTTLSRDTVLASSAGGTTKVTFSAGTKDVFVTQPAQRAVYDSTGSTGGTDSTSINTANAVVRRDGSGNFSANAITATSVLQRDTSIGISDGLTTFTGSVAQTSFIAYGSISGTTFTVTAINGTGAIVVGATLSGVSGALPMTITALGTGTGGTGTYTVSATANSTLAANYTVSYGTLNVTAVASGTLGVGTYISNVLAATGANTVIPTNTFITALGTGTGTTGTYILNKAFTLVSSTIYGGGTVTTTVDAQKVTSLTGGNTYVRPTEQLGDAQGAIFSNRLIGAYVTRGTRNYYMDLSQDGQIVSGDALSYLTLTTTASRTASPVVAAYTGSYGTNSGFYGLGFSPYTVNDMTRTAVGLTPTGAVAYANTVTVGMLSTGPRINFVKYFDDASNPRYNTAYYVAREHNFSDGAVYWGAFVTVTGTTASLGHRDHFIVFNTTATCTLTLPTAATSITATLDNGSGTASGTTLTVSAISGQAIYVGMSLWSTQLGTAEYVTVTAFGTGTGGTGTYTVNNAGFLGSTTFAAPIPATGREITLKNTAAFAINSSASNIVPQAGGAAGTAILAATAGKWCTLVFNGTNWEIMTSN